MLTADRKLFVLNGEERKVIGMNKRFCDRCGNKIKETKRTVFDALSDAVETLKVNFGGKHRIKYRVQIIDLDDQKIPYPIADLCEQCERELTAFMNEVKKKKNEKEGGRNDGQ